MRCVRDILVCVLLGVAICIGVEGYHAIRDFRALEAQTTATLNTTQTAVRDTSSMLNANLIHLDLILGRAERVSRSQEAYWNTLSTQTSALLGHADRVLVDLDKNQNVLAIEGVKTLQETQRSVVFLGQTIQHTDATLNGPEIKQILSNVNGGTASLAASSAHIEAATKDVQEEVHHITHPRVITKIATWTLRIVHALGSWF